MEISIQKWGNSAAMRLPAELLRQLKISPGDKLAVTVLPEGLMLKPKRRSYKLAELLDQCDKTAPLPADLDIWNQTTPVGREIW